MADARPTPAPQPEGATGVVVFADGRVAWGRGFGAEGEAVGELCFNTAMTGYQEVMTDPSYAKQVVAFTFPHIGNVGANPEDVEAADAHALGCLVREEVTAPSNFRSTGGFRRLDGGEWADRDFGGRYAGADASGAARGAADDCVCASCRWASSIWRRCGRARRNGRGSRGWTWPTEVSRTQLENWTGGKWVWGRGMR